MLSHAVMLFFMATPKDRLYTNFLFLAVAKRLQKFNDKGAKILIP